MIINNISTKDISFVVQGAVEKKITKQCLKSIRDNFPQAEIILSTWKRTDVTDLDYDKVIFSNDPGCVNCDFNTVPNNLNRQIISSSAGLSVAKRKYVAKVRSDLFFNSPSFLYYFNKFDKYDPKYCKVKSRMIILSLYTRSFYVSYQTNKFNLSNFHFSDWFCFGFRDDVCRYYQIDPVEDLTAFSKYYLDKPELHHELPYHHLMLKLTPEQFLGTTFLEIPKNNIIDCSSHTDFVDSQKYLVNNFVVLNYAYSDIFSLKWEERSKNEWDMPHFETISLIFYEDFLKMYNKYCDPNFDTKSETIDYIQNRKLKILKEVLFYSKIKKVYNKLVKPKLFKIYSTMKLFLALFLPSYRVARKNREEILRLKKDELDRFNYINFRLDQIDEKLNKGNKNERASTKK